MDKKKFSLYDGGGDVSKRWYVHCKIGGKRKLFYGDLSKHKDLRSRREAAARLINELSKSQTPLKGSIAAAVESHMMGQRAVWRHKTFLSLRSKWRKFVAFVGINPDSSDIQSFFLHIKQKLKPGTYNDYVQVIGQLLRAVGAEMPHVARAKKVEPRPAQYFSTSQVRFLAKEIGASDAELWLFIQFIYYCFIRPGELRLLRVGDIMPEDGKILVRGDISKNRKDQYVAIPAPFKGSLDSLMSKNPNYFVFGGAKPRRKDYYSRRHQSILKALGFDTTKYKLYSWKHSGAVACARAGVPMKQLQIQLRHHSLDQVNDYLRQMGVSDLADLSDMFPSI